ncbi:MAG: RHS repeat-associated core domain-containing protein [Burkholderiales bacterium]|nr:RHS repeat-associated core domain-containing protein [Burkholderiales bacterium]
MSAEISARNPAAHPVTRAATPVAAVIALFVLTAPAFAQSCSPAEPRIDSGVGFKPFGANEQVLARGGNKGPAWEWAIGTDTEAGRTAQGSLDWVSGRVYSWKLVNSGSGSQMLEVREEGSLRLSLAYPSEMDAGNALELRVSTNPSIGPETVMEAKLTRLNAYPVSGSLSGSGTRGQSTRTLYYYFPQMAQGFTAEGTVGLTFSTKLPTGSRVQFTVRAGTIPCSSPGNAPTVSITSPAAGSAFGAPASVTVTADAQDSDGTVAQVDFFANGSPIGTDTASPFTIDWANVQAGVYSLTAVATDNEGLQTTSAAVPITVGAGKALYFIHVDHLNTPRLIADGAQKTVWRWDQQEPFGNNPANEDPDGDGIAFSFPKRFPGQYYDAETLLHYNYFRDYDPGLGVFKESDLIGLDGGLNTYSYVAGRPLTYFDPKGLVNIHGNWCGPGGSGPIQDGLDQCCYDHDSCYEKCGATWRDKVGGTRDPRRRILMQSCDKSLCECLEEVEPKTAAERRGRARVQRFFKCKDLPKLNPGKPVEG